VPAVPDAALVLESRNEAAFLDDWRRWGRKEADGIAAALAIG
jgi:hypothetical protein